VVRREERGGGSEGRQGTGPKRGRKNVQEREREGKGGN
jgi:hypothetical protein